MGALQDYDEASFRHFEGVHIGRKALTAAVKELRAQARCAGDEDGW